jgi:hypothetical protein
MCTCRKTDVRNRQRDCTLASRKGYSSHGEMFHLLYATVLFPLWLNTLYITLYICPLNYMRVSQKASALYMLKLTKQQFITHKHIIFQHGAQAFQYTWPTAAKAYAFH